MGLDLLLMEVQFDDTQRHIVETILHEAQKISGIVGKMRTAHTYVTKSYLADIDIVDLEAVSQDDVCPQEDGTIPGEEPSR